MCKKVDFRIECIQHGYPYSEAMFPDSKNPLPCDGQDQLYEDHITKCKNKVVDIMKARYAKKTSNREELSKKLLEYAKKLNW